MKPDAAALTTSEQPAPSNRNRRQLVTWSPILIAIIAVIVAAFLVLRPSSQTPGLVGKPAPEFSLRSVNGASVSLASLRGHPILVNFWGTTCLPCRREVPLLQQAYEKYRAQGLIVIGLDSQLEDAQSVSAFGSERNVTYPMLLDPNGAVAPTYGVNALPHSFLIDRNGVVRGNEQAPFFDAAPLDQALKAIL
ncbi:MAG: thiol-disulfide isomerase-like thioredoxin [Chloroflexi bacterium]|nr:thiol-disulfide isomerase-like thioredoxin [Chloroflexota bacterium]